VGRWWGASLVECRYSKQDTRAREVFNEAALGLVRNVMTTQLSLSRTGRHFDHAYYVETPSRTIAATSCKFD